MFSFNNQNITSDSYNERGPARKISAAVRAVIEPVEARFMYSTSPATVLNQQVSAISAKYETTALPDAGEAASDPTIWVNPADSSKSTIIGTDKEGSINVYDLTGNLIQSITNGDYYKVDNRSGFSLGGKSVSIVAADRIDTNTLSLFTVDSDSGKLTDVTAGTIQLDGGADVTGVAMYQSADTGKTYVFVSSAKGMGATGMIEQFELSDNGNGKIAATSVRTISVGSGAEGMTVDDENDALYVAQDGVAIWKYGAEPTDGSVRTEIDSHATGEVSTYYSESLSLYKGANGTGYLIAARQNTNDYVVYDRQTGAYVTKFNITNGTNGVDDVSSADGIAVTSASLGKDFAGGAFVAEDDNNYGANQNYKIVSWADIANAQAIPLAIDTAQTTAPVVSDPVVTPPVVTDPVVTSPVVTDPVDSTPDTTKTTAPTKTSTPTTTGNAAAATIGIQSLTLMKANSNTKLATLTNGATINLADYSGVNLDIRANTIGATIGSVVFGLNGVAKYSVENWASFDLAGSAGVLTPTVGTYTITATAYSEHDGKGVASATYSVTFKVVDTTDTAPPSTGTSPESNVPTTVKSVTVTPSASSNQITVAWKAADKEADGFEVDRSTDGGKTYKQVAKTTSTSYADANVTIGTTYTYRVIAYNSIGTSAASTGISAALPQAATVTTTVPAPTGRPSLSTTGVQSKAPMTTVGTFTAKSNTTYSNLIVNGMINCKGLTNVTIINCIIDGGFNCAWGVRSDDGATNITIQNCEIRNVTDSAVYGEGFKAINNYVHQTGGDGFDPTGNALIQGNYVTNLGWNSPLAHADGVQVTGGDNIKIIGNFFNMPTNVANTKSNSSLMLSGQSLNVTFDSNWCIGGNYTVRAYSDNAIDDLTIKITNNIFYTGTPQFGFGQIGAGVLWLGNKTDGGGIATANVSAAL